VLLIGLAAAQLPGPWVRTAGWLLVAGWITFAASVIFARTPG